MGSQLFWVGKSFFVLTCFLLFLGILRYSPMEDACFYTVQIICPSNILQTQLISLFIICLCVSSWSRNVDQGKKCIVEPSVEDIAVGTKDTFMFFLQNDESHAKRFLQNDDTESHPSFHFCFYLSQPNLPIFVSKCFLTPSN